jgi:hypothetical protein
VTVTGLIGTISIAALLIGIIMLMNLIQKAFDREGVVWGFIAMIYPPGTYMFCRKNWDVYRKQFIVTSLLVGVSLVLWVVIQLFAHHPKG